MRGFIHLVKTYVCLLMSAFVLAHSFSDETKTLMHLNPWCFCDSDAEGKKG